ncbi:hypothetical protein CW667_02605 [Candidatus Bathyarchaeota archaeon]|nr:MAG: hypothetical protein CW667_02605 [Candidatus Bathyarchaeota archaeon]RLI18476.1 MAG: hypothetical protein DRO44_01030 [Candidatus Bathyarchaeota archaeon]HDD70327.1 hypothetical protein [Candidatus Bathyarchaeota archaeon]
MSELISPIAYQIGVGGVGGFVVGYAVKKISKLVMILIGLAIITLLYLGASGILNINYDKLWEALSNFFVFLGDTVSWFASLIVSVLPFMGSFIAGFLLGFRFG